MWLGTLGASLSGNMLADRGLKTKKREQGAIRTGDGVIQASKKKTIKAG